MKIFLQRVLSSPVSSAHGLEPPYQMDTSDLYYVSIYSYLQNTGFNGNGDRRNVPNIAVIITDGGSNEKQETMEAAYKAKRVMLNQFIVNYY